MMPDSTIPVQSEVAGQQMEKVQYCIQYPTVKSYISVGVNQY